MSLEFYQVTCDIIDYYKRFDSKVLDNYSQKRKYIGVLVHISDYDYIIPLSSPKDNDYDNEGFLKKNTFTIFRLEDFKSTEDKKEYYDMLKNLNPRERKEKHMREKSLGKLYLSNMIPVKIEDIEKINYEKESTSYVVLLQKQYSHIKDIKKKIEVNSKVIYNAKTRNEEKGFVKVCCDFRLLEKKRNLK